MVLVLSRSFTPPPGDLPNPGAEPRSSGTQTSLWARLILYHNCVTGYLNSSYGRGLVAKLRPILAVPWTIVCQASLSMGFPRQEHWSGLPFPPSKCINICKAIRKAEKQRKKKYTWKHGSKSPTVPCSFWLTIFIC